MSSVARLLFPGSADPLRRPSTVAFTGVSGSSGNPGSSGTSGRGLRFSVHLLPDTFCRLSGVGNRGFLRAGFGVGLVGIGR